MNPYEARPDKIPPTDLYADIPLHGRYVPREDEFRVDLAHAGSHSAESIKYWEEVLRLCNEAVRIYPADDGGRDVFASGNIIVKSSHLHAAQDGQPVEIDYSYADANEVQAIALARTVLAEVRVPEIYFCGKIHGRQVLVQERIHGVGLNVAWPYLSWDQRQAFKEQARDLLRRLRTLGPTDGRRARSHVVPDPHILTNGRILDLEKEILFSGANADADLAFMHNDVSPSNCIVDDDRIVGLVDWEMAGFFGWRAAAEVHRRVRSPQREHFARAGLSEERLRDLLFWNDLYDVDGPDGARAGGLSSS
ncbi:hypothetical protein VTK73DRAFT_8091 [Phialemonium thermophilum]|uniref:Aminoglycoside phosphotransferase domain-containing protein n=1 Tax=Phialemonium thermophilum TaxID=223376 RepID=A0ABR3WAH9_9PEZI